MRYEASICIKFGHFHDSYGALVSVFEYPNSRGISLVRESFVAAYLQSLHWAQWSVLCCIISQRRDIHISHLKNITFETLGLTPSVWKGGKY